MSAVTASQPDNLTITTLARQIGEVMFDAGELGVLEKKLDPQLRAKVSRILHRYEEYPEQRRDIEQKLMSLDDPELGVAILQQAYLVRSETTEESIISQLVRMAGSGDRRTSGLTLDALREAARSEIPRLQNLGCKALFRCDADRVTELELVGFAREGRLRFSHRLGALAALLNRSSIQSVDVLRSTLLSWANLNSNDRSAFERELFQLARRFEVFAALPPEQSQQIVQRLFNLLDTGLQTIIDKQVANTAKKVVQAALASMQQPTMDYLESLSADDRNFGSIFTLGTIARRTPAATRMLLQWLMSVFDGTTYYQGFRWCEQVCHQLKSANWESDALYVQLDQVLLALNQISIPHEEEENLRSELQQLRSGARKDRSRKVTQVLRDLAEAYVMWPTLEDKQAFDLRFLFERQNKYVNISTLSEAEHCVLLEALKRTYEHTPWETSTDWWIRAYPSVKGEEKFVVLEAIGFAAQRKRQGETESLALKQIRKFYEDVVEKGTPPEAENAGMWLDRLAGPAMPVGITREDT